MGSLGGVPEHRAYARPSSRWLTLSGIVTVVLAVIASPAFAPAAPNKKPKAVAPSGTTTSEDQATSVILTGTDTESSALTFTVTDAPAYGTLDATTVTVSSCPEEESDYYTCRTTLTYTPDPNYSGSDAFGFTVTDEGGATSGPAAVEITIAAMDDAPIASDSSSTVAEGSSTQVQASATDDDADPLTFEVVSRPSHGTLTTDSLSCDGMTCTQTYTYTPDVDYNGSDSFTFRASDGDLGSNVGTITLEVTQTNDVPSATPTSTATDEDVAVTLTLEGSDIDGDILSFLIVDQPENGTVEPSGAVGCTGTTCSQPYTYTPALNFNGIDTFSFKTNDGDANSGLAVVTVTVAGADDAPVASPASVTVAEDGDGVVSVTATDAEGDTLVVVITSPPAHGVLEPVGGTICDGGSCTQQYRYTPEDDFAGSDSFAFEVSDANSSSSASVDVSVTPVDDSPLAASGSAATEEDSATAVTLTGSDVDGDVLTFVVGSPAFGTLSPIGAVSCSGHRCTQDFTYTPNPNFNGSDTFTFKTSDGELESTPAPFWLMVAPVNDAPTASPATVTAQEQGGPITIDLTGVVADLETADADLTFVIADAPDAGTLSGDGLIFQYTPGPDGSFTFTYRVVDRGDPDGCGEASDVCDAPRSSEGATVTIEVAPFVPGPVDSVPPETTITSAPPAFVNDGMVTFAFVGSERFVGFECSLDFGPFSPCTSPQSIVVLSDGPHAFQVRAVDQNGNVDPSPAVYRLVLDRMAPEGDIWQSAPAISPNSDGRLDSVLIRARLSEEVLWELVVVAPDGSVRYRTEGASDAMAALWDPASTAAPLQEGVHLWRLTAVDAAGNATELAGAVVVDTTAPVITGVEVTRNPFRLRAGRSTRISFDLTEASTVRVDLKKRGRVSKTFGPLRVDAGEPVVIRWWGFNRSGFWVRPGRFRVVISAEDAAGNLVRHRGPVLRVLR